MINTKEYNDILEIFKELISNNEITITDESFSISYIKSLLISNPKFQNAIISLQEKTNNQSDRNKNIFSLIKMLNKKKGKEARILLNNLSTNFSIFYNEPNYIIDLNKRIYDSILEDIKSKKTNYKMISIINGNFSEDLFNMKSEFYNNANFSHLNYESILEKIYSTKNDNILFELNPSQFRFKLNSYTMSSLRELYSSMIHSWNEISEEKIKTKKRKDQITKLIQENKRIQLIELCKGGIPNSLRKNIYSILLNIENENKISINQNDNILIFDYYLLRDIHRITSSENYFLFEENLIRLLCLLIRDTELLTQIQESRPILTLKLKEDSNELSSTYIPFPPSGMFPFQGLAFQLATFTYMSNIMEDYYPIAKFFYAKYLSYTTSFTTNKKSILSLLSSFNNIFNKIEIFSFLKKHFNDCRFDINCQVLYWFLTAFATVLGPQSVFWLFDLIILSDNMGIFILFALALINYRKSQLLTLNSKDEIESCFENIMYDQINCLKILNDFLNDIN